MQQKQTNNTEVRGGYQNTSFFQVVDGCSEGCRPTIINCLFHVN